MQRADRFPCGRHPHGTKAKPNVGRHRLYAAEDARRRRAWMQGGSWEDALELQRPAADDALVMPPLAPNAAA